MSSEFVKAIIMKMDKEGQHVEERHVVMFNPKELNITKQNNWQPGKSPKQNAPTIEFSGGGPASLKLQLFFDTYAERTDVRREHTDKIYDLMFVDPKLTDTKNKKGRPPLVRFQWGSIGFTGVITNISQRFTLFLSTGTPVRAVLDVTFQQARDEAVLPMQNPTSGGEGGERVWMVKEGETLQAIAAIEYGDPNQWRAIANANQLARVRYLTPGRVLAIPAI